jgi:hypothetical protein
MEASKWDTALRNGVTKAMWRHVQLKRPASPMIKVVTTKPDMTPIRTPEAAKQKAHRNGRAFSKSLVV